MTTDRYRLSVSQITKDILYAYRNHNSFISPFIIYNWVCNKSNLDWCQWARNYVPINTSSICTYVRIYLPSYGKSLIGIGVGLISLVAKWPVGRGRIDRKLPTLWGGAFWFISLLVPNKVAGSAVSSGRSSSGGHPFGSKLATLTTNVTARKCKVTVKGGSWKVF
jgi:hypothetical protein